MGSRRAVDAPQSDLEAPAPLVALGRRLAQAHAQLLQRGQRESAPLQPAIAGLPVALRAAREGFGRPSEAARLGLDSVASEWFLDNFYAVEQASMQVRRDLPVDYQRELPSLATGTPRADLPRVYALAQELLIHEGFHLDIQRLFEFLDAYQLDQPLTLGEVWALPTMLRLVLLQHLACAGLRLAQTLPAAAPPPRAMREVKCGLTESGVSDEDVVARCIPGLKTIDVQDWEEGAERLSVVHHLLAAGDPCGVYPRMDFDTRDRYRRAIERLSRACAASEPEVTRLAVQLAAAAPGAVEAGTPADIDEAGVQPLQLDQPRARHVGTYLIGEGQAALEAELGCHPNPVDRLRRHALSHPTIVYLGSIAAVTLLIVSVGVEYAGHAGARTGMLLVTLACSLIPALTAGVSGVNAVLLRGLQPRVLPKLDFEKGIDPSCRAVVVVSTLVATPEQVDEVLLQLRDHALRNPDPALTFAALADFPDADAETSPLDEELLTYAEHALRRLNATTAGAPFLYLHRRRLWNASQGVWMGWERKRGKLHELNRLIRGARDTSYFLVAGDIARLDGIRFVITLDADTMLPSGAAARLVGTLAHPLNRAGMDPKTHRIVDGYTILQPRAEINPATAARSVYAELFGGDATIDLYTRAVSDVYQDLFGAGIYVGKGIYDLDAFEESLAGRIPENALLSHDHFEGSHGRVGLVTDIVVYERYPANYLSGLLRSHRWMRGDWQLLPWLGPRVPRAAGRGPNDLPTIDRWKLLDNLRRALLAPATLTLLLVSWLWLPGSSLVWAMYALLVPLASLALAVLSTLGALMRDVLRHNPYPSWRGRVIHLRNRALRWLLFVAFLCIEATVALDALLRTLWRLLVSHRLLLEWTTSAQVTKAVGEDVPWATTVRRTLPGFASAGAMALLLAVVHPQRLPQAAPLLGLWLLAPALVHVISLPRRRRKADLSTDDLRTLRVLARQTWMFYESLVGPDDNWLPPDNFQEQPLGLVAHRTSPTNVGLYLLSTLAALDRGYLGMIGFETRLRFAFASMERLHRHRGHFLNWVDTRTLEGLTPAYVSTVDSGNLAGCLLTLRQGLCELPARPVWVAAVWEGLADTVELVRDVLPEGDGTSSPLSDFLAEMADVLAHAGEAPEEWPDTLRRLHVKVRSSLSHLVAESVESHGKVLELELVAILSAYALRLERQLDRAEYELRRVLPLAFNRTEAPPALSEGLLGAQVHDAWVALQSAVPIDVRWRDVAACTATAREWTRALTAAVQDATGDGREQTIAWLHGLDQRLALAAGEATDTLEGIERMAEQSARFVADMRFDFLYNHHRGVFHIGYAVDAARLDSSHYDLLASEARLASMLALSRGEVPERHWLRLARPMTRTLTGERTLLSWSGTMFEYLMPTLLVPTPVDSVLGRSCAAAVEHQIAYAKARHVPWGISESGCFSFDSARAYQYQAFGVPGLGLRRGLAEDLVIAPYASMLALPYDPKSVVDNLAQLRGLGLVGRYGLYEAIDFTKPRLPLGQEHALVRSYMAHHQGMIMLALANYLEGPSMVDRFAAEPQLARVALLLLEGMSDSAPLRLADEDESWPAKPLLERNQPWLVTPDAAQPRVHHLSNGRYRVLLTGAGGGHSDWRDVRLTRWRADATLEEWGSWLYVQEPGGEPWSVGRQPTGRMGEREEVTFHPGWAGFQRTVDGLNVAMDVTVAPGDDVEIRRVTLANESDLLRRAAVASYAEVAMADAEDDFRHPGFAKLFIEAEEVADLHAVLLHRRPRAAADTECYVLHCIVREPHAPQPQEPQLWGRFARTVERARFLGRGHTPRSPLALSTPGWWDEDQALSSAPLDPALALGQEVHLQPHARARLAFLTIATTTRAQALGLARHYQNWSVIEHTFSASAAAADHELATLGFTGTALEDTQRLLGLLRFPAGGHRAPATERASSGAPGRDLLWGQGISGDLPILLVEVSEEDHLHLLAEVVRAHTYWRRQGVPVDLVILDSQTTGYDQAPRAAMLRLIRRMDGDRVLNQRAGIFVITAQKLSMADRSGLRVLADAYLDGARGGLAQQLAQSGYPSSPLPLLPIMCSEGVQAALGPESGPAVVRPNDLLFDNGFGGFTPDGREYVITLQPGARLPAPWANVIATPDFGCLVTEAGLGTTWSMNSSENRLTPWHNDALRDPAAEAVYLRDDETGCFWTPTPAPAPAARPYLIRHGAGYTEYELTSHALEQRLRVYVSPDAPVKVVRIRLRNLADRPRGITATYFADWVLGVHRDESQAHVETWFDDQAPALFARNRTNVEFGERVAFVATDQPVHGWTCDRTEFLGRLGSCDDPAALHRIGLAQQAGDGFDPAAVLQVHISLAPGACEEVTFLVGEGQDAEDAVRLVQHHRDAAAIDAAWAAARDLWDEILGAVQVKTPDPAFDLLMNRWLLYQTLSCRIWGRTALYQSSGAYGFRDQLQDVLALIWTRPDLARAHVLRAAAHQFPEGDVLHWWHPPTGRGVRTRITDDLLWLPWVTDRYVEATGDDGILRERVPFRQGSILADNEVERYDQYPVTDTDADLLEHCRRALGRIRTGIDGLPLMGAGDWNDGMNRVGIEGRGQSVWLGWFAYAALHAHANLCARSGLSDEADGCRARADALFEAIEARGWDGAWFRRATFDDGSAVGSSASSECRIDSIAQTWAVLSGAPRGKRASDALDAVATQLVREQDAMILLFTPPFDGHGRNPGYIQGYIPGVRENGGQYTHAAVWAVWAAAELGRVGTAVRWFGYLNPIRHTSTPDEVARYAVEPYVVAADVYSAAGHVGRGGWTWYTGSSGWLYRCGLEAILGLHLDGGSIRVEPNLPDDWPGFTARIRVDSEQHMVTVTRGADGPLVHVDRAG